ncbi:hypothetical protein Francci3_1337 [Frankia casuarinae]|uniref:Uncharacterized protein n=1 Tax=Frankia casuarinae (strain DSM 45818 / CECT 9043 / HFP020203 / CcI3) TaxID=106370 RepID=Q2JDC8_FRACC|nr:hypothetical protein Francci3_1337 [Frankia casuarinae]
MRLWRLTVTEMRSSGSDRHDEPSESTNLPSPPTDADMTDTIDPRTPDAYTAHTNSGDNATLRYGSRVSTRDPSAARPRGRRGVGLCDPARPVRRRRRDIAGVMSPGLMSPGVMPPG